MLAAIVYSMKCSFLLNTKRQVWGQWMEGVLDSFVDRVMNVRCLTCGYKFHILVSLSLFLAVKVSFLRLHAWK